MVWSPAPSIDLPGEPPGWLLRSIGACGAAVGPRYLPGSESEDRDGSIPLPSSEPCPCWAEPITSCWLFFDDDSSSVGSLALTLAAGWRVGWVEVPDTPRFFPLQGLRTSRYPGEDAFPPSPRGLGIAPSVAPTVVAPKGAPLIPCPRAVSRERIAPTPSKHWKTQRMVGRSVGLLTWLGIVWPVAASCSRSRCAARR